MRACMLTTNYPPVGGGVSRYNWGLVSAAGGLISVAGQDYLSAPPRGDGLVPRIRQIFWAYRICRSLPRDTAALASQPHLAVGAWLAKREFAIFIHGGEWEDYLLGRKLLRRFATRARVCVFSSEATMERFNPRREKSGYLIIRPGLSLNVPVRESTQILRTKHGGEFKIICVARLTPRKGHHKLVRAVQACLDWGLDVSLTCVGSGALEAELRTLVRPGDPIRFETHTDDMQLLELYDEADLFVMVPEETKGGESWEGFGIVYLEAAARGLPIIGTRTGGVSEATCPDGAMLISQNCTANEISGAILGLHRNAETREKMKLANLGWASQNSWASRSDLILELLGWFVRGESNG